MDLRFVLAVWLAVNTAGLIVAGWAVWDAWQDTRLTRNRTNGRQIYASASLRMQLMKCAKFGLFELVGLVVLPVEAGRSVSPFSLALLAVAVLMFTDSVLDWITRRRVWHVVDERDRENQRLREEAARLRRERDELSP